MAHQWRGVIREYADRLPVTESTKVITLGEGGTPLVHAQKLSELTGLNRNYVSDVERGRRNPGAAVPHADLDPEVTAAGP